MKKVISLTLSIIIIISLFIPVYSQDAQNADAYKISVNSTQLGQKDMVLVKTDTQYLMSLNDILEMTRSTRTDNGDIIDIKHGTREIRMSKSLQQITEKAAETNESHFTIRIINGIEFVPAQAMLTYLGATCTLLNNVIQVSMPAYTNWEAMDFNIDEYNLDINEIWGSESDLTANITCDVIMQMIYGIGIFGSINTVIEDAMYDVLNVDMFDYDSCNVENLKIINKLNNSLKSNDILVETANAYNNLEFKDKITKVIDMVSDSTGLIGENLLQTANQTQSIISKGELNSLLVKSAKSKYLCDELSTASNYVDAVILTADIVSTAYTRANYTQNTKSSISVFESELGKFDKNIAYYTIANKINNDINSKNIYMETAIEKTVGFYGDEIKDKAIEEGLALITGNKALSFALDVGKFVTALIPSNANHIKATDADLKGLFLAELQKNVMLTVNNKTKDIENKKYQNVMQLDELKSLLSYYVRVTMSANDKLLIVANSSSGNKSYADILKDRNEKLSVILFKLTNAPVQAIVNLKGLLDNKDIEKNLTLNDNNKVSTDSIVASTSDFGVRPVFILEQGNSTFCVAGLNGNKSNIIKIDNNTNESKMIIDDKVDGFILTDKYIYYYTIVTPSYEETVLSYGGDLKRSNLDGSNIVSIGDIRCKSNFLIKGDTIYYFEEVSSDRSDLYSCDLDGNNKKLITQLNGCLYGAPIAVLGNKLYYYSSKSNLYYINLSDYNDFGIVQENVSRFNFDEIGAIKFYSRNESELVANKLVTSGEIEKQTYQLPQKSNYVGIVGNYIYYSEGQQLVKNSNGSFSITNDKLFSLNLKTQANNELIDKYNYSFICNQNQIFTIENNTIINIDTINGQKVRGVFSKNSSVYIMLVQVTDGWIYCYEAMDGEQLNNNLVRFNKKSGEKQIIGEVETYRG